MHMYGWLYNWLAMLLLPRYRDIIDIDIDKCLSAECEDVQLRIGHVTSADVTLTSQSNSLLHSHTLSDCITAAKQSLRGLYLLTYLLIIAIIISHLWSRQCGRSALFNCMCLFSRGRITEKAEPGID